MHADRIEGADNVYTGGLQQRLNSGSRAAAAQQDRSLNPGQPQGRCHLINASSAEQHSMGQPGVLEMRHDGYTVTAVSFRAAPVGRGAGKSD
jgi:hypothetical protein